ncbi:hypothetical protein [Spirillospora sp. CA-294931]|uniref:hypothetical protein n=1 Tax=Spirillospora sp. CA-294931 TaxID=3240042 RepID=UPI003D94A8B1
MALVVIKIMWDSYTPPVPHNRLGQVNPDGVRYDRVADLPGLATPDVRGWVTAHLEQVRSHTGRDDVHAMVCFADGLERSQVDPPHDLEVTVTGDDQQMIRSAARADLADFLAPLGHRVDHLRA